MGQLESQTSVQVDLVVKLLICDVFCVKITAMVRFHSKLDDFWSLDLEQFVFPQKYNAGQRQDFHTNYSQDSNDLWQAFDHELPSIRQRFFTDLELTQGAVSWTCIEPGQVIPVHTDQFYRLRQQHQVPVQHCLRYLIFLQPWTLGHWVEFQEHIITKWNIGDVWVFDHASSHCAANASNQNFVTCQVNTVTK